MPFSANPNAIQLLEKHPDKIKWCDLSSNPNAVLILEKYPQYMDRISWINLSSNPNAVPILEKYPDKINWRELSKNPSAIELLEKNQDKIDWDYLLYKNPAIFTYNYVVMREANQELKEELIQRAWHPSRVARWLEAGVDLEDL